MEKSPRDTKAAAPVVELTGRLAAGDETAFREFHTQYFERLYRFLLVVTRGQEHEAREALQDTLLRVARYARAFDSEEAFWSWLQVLARSAARDAGRKQRRYKFVLERFACHFRLSASRQASDVGEDRLRGALQESLAELAPDERYLLEAKYLAGSTVRELCREAGSTEKGLESRLVRLRHLLRERILKKLKSP